MPPCRPIARITDELIAQHGGRIFGTAGDSVLAEFATVFAAVECAIDIQRELAIANKPLDETRRLRFRIGINVGDVMVKDGDIFGDGVNIAARLEGLAEPGGICISRGVRDHIRHKLPHKFEDLGEQAVKNIAQPVRCFRLFPREGKPEPPPPPSRSRCSRSCPRRRRARSQGGRAGVLGIDQGQPAAGRLRGLSRAVSRRQFRRARAGAAPGVHRFPGRVARSDGRPRGRARLLGLGARERQFQFAAGLSRQVSRRASSAPWRRSASRNWPRRRRRR